jgi:glycosyltransferase involved in cell wall biosynthesis
MKICYFGTYEEKYPLNRVLIKGLRKNNIEVIECHEAVWEKYQNKTGNFLKIFSMFFLFLRMIFAYAKLGRKFFKECKNIDFYVVGYIGQIDVFVLRFLTFLKRDKAKIIFLPLFSLYDGAVIDRKLFRKKGLPAKLLFFLDKYSMQLADIVFLDTNEHADYVSGLLGVDRKKIGRSLVGADEEIFYPIKNYSASRTNPDFTVLFFGKYIPLHGLEHIIGAAKLLENEKNIRFKMIGNGQLYEEIISLSESFDLQNVEFVSWVEYEKLKEEIKEADAILGIFGGTEKR